MKQVFELSDIELEKVAAKGAEVVTEDLQDQIGEIRMLGRLKTGLITIQDIATLFGVEPRTVHDWPLEPVEAPTRKNLYRVKEVGEQLAESP